MRNVLGIGSPEGSSSAYQLGGDIGFGLAIIIPGDEESAALDVGAETNATIGDARDELNKAGVFVDKLNNATTPPENASGGSKIVRALAQIARLIQRE